MSCGSTDIFKNAPFSCTYTHHEVTDSTTDEIAKIQKLETKKC